MYKEDLALNNLQWLICHEVIYILTYKYKEDLALNNLQWLICRKIKPNQNIINYINSYFKLMQTGLKKMNKCQI